MVEISMALPYWRTHQQQGNHVVELVDDALDRQAVGDIAGPA
jgi:hypothetical protein